MHPYTIPESVRQRALDRQGRLPSHETIDAARSALLVVDMQNYFVAERFPSAVPLARTIVPNINRMARAMRSVGGAVVWIQTTATGALEHWGKHHRFMLTPERRERRLDGLAEGSDGFRLFDALEADAGDLCVKKVKYSALIPGSSDLQKALEARGIETVLIAGTATNVCCESTARDAMLLDFRVIMLADGNAAQSDEEHAATLNNCLLFFGDVMTTDEAISRLAPVARRKSA